MKAVMNPIGRFSQWYKEEADRAAPGYANAMTLATATHNAAPSARIVLLKHHDDRGFVFFTNLQSRKSMELKQNPQAALCFYWPNRQVRVTGYAEQVSEKEADDYFNSRPLISRLGAIASDQSRPLDSRETLVKKVEALQEQYSETNPPPRPPHWSGWRVVPETIEFWEEGAFRLHDREVYTRNAQGSWSVQRLYP